MDKNFKVVVQLKTGHKINVNVGSNDLVYNEGMFLIYDGEDYIRFFIPKENVRYVFCERMEEK